MKVIISNLTVGLIILAMTTPIFAQDEVEAVSTEETPAFTLSGSVDAYFRTNLGGDFDSAPVSSFANLPGFNEWRNQKTRVKRYKSRRRNNLYQAVNKNK